MAPSLLETFAASLLEGTLARLLATDPAAAAELARLAPARLRLRVSAPPVALTLVLTETGLAVESADEDAADAVITVTPAGLFEALAGRQEEAVLAGLVTTDGDTVLASRFFEVLRRFRPELERPLARIFGEVPAAAATQAAERTGAAAREAARASLDGSRAWLTRADGPLPARHEVARFLDEVDDVRMATDRLEARLAVLRRRLDGEPPA